MNTHESTTGLSLFNYAESQRLRDEGIAVASDQNASVLDQAKRAAREIALSRESRECTSDDVARRMLELGHHRNALGNAAGGTFKGREWQFTGRFVNSQRLAAHARAIRVWRYLGK